jgi:ADP-ribose pyrophosphatase
MHNKDYLSMLNYSKLLKTHPNLFSNDNAFLKIIKDPKIRIKWQKSKERELASLNQPESWAQIGVVYNDPYIVVIRDLIEFPDGHIGSYFRVMNQADLNGGQGVAVLSEMEGKFLLLHQYRHPTRCWSYEAPRGFGEPGVSAEEQAKNEVREEVGGEIDELIDLGIYFSNTGLEGNKVKLFYARQKSVGQLAVDEGIDSILWVSLAELEEMIANVTITDGFTIAAYTRAKLRGLI